MRAGNRYRYYKGGDYEVVEVSAGGENGDRQVRYRRVDGDETWTCSLASFLQSVDLDGVKVPRFKRI